MFRERLLRCHPLKTCYVICGSEKFKKKVREEFDRSPLMFGDFAMAEKHQDVYLGDVLSSNGLAASVEATIALRMGKVKGVMYEVAAMVADHRMPWGHIVPELSEGTWWSSHSVMHFFGSSGAKDQLPGH